MSKIKPTDHNHKSYLRRRRNLATAVETITKGEWEDDDDAAVPFHLQDDDAMIINDEDWEEAANKGIIYSNTTGSKEIQVIKQSSKRPPPPPPPPPKKKNIVKDIIQDHETNIKNEKSNELYKVDPNYAPSKELNHTIMDNIDDIPADTIFDDLLRGFTFAAFFCLVLYILYKCCYCACVKCGLFPDERVLEARMRRMRLRKKRSYRLANENEHEPPLDTREWAVWHANREKIGRPEDDEIWDAGDSSDDDEQLRLDCQDEGFIEFDSENGVELTTKPSIWDKKGDDNASSDMVLEYGEGTELEDLSHDGRLFDNVDNGQGVVREANKFFEGKEIGKKKVGEVVQKKKERKEKSFDKTFEKAKVDVIDKDTSPPNKEFTQEDDLFDIQQQGGESNHDDDAFPLDSLPAYPSTQDKSMNGTATTSDETTKQQQRRKPRKEPSTKGFSNSIVVEDRKYDEETDILGLFSDEPPPLGLEEMSRIEEKLNNNMKEAKLY